MNPLRLGTNNMKNLNFDNDLSGDESKRRSWAISEEKAAAMSAENATEEAANATGEISKTDDAAANADLATPVRHDDALSAKNPEAVDPEPEKASAAKEAVYLKTPQVHIGDFSILKVLGRGAYGKVFQVRKIKGPGEGSIYAMKAMNKSRICGSKTDVRHTKAERNVLVSVDHPFIVKLKFAFETPQRLYLVQEFCCGGELFRRMEVERLMIEQDAKFYLQEILLALEYLHDLDIVYRDLKTENVMLDREGHVKLIDFGLSKTDMRDDTLTRTFCGTVEYMAPEVILKDPGYGKPADWWSFGVFTFDLLTGRSPFHSNRGKQATKDNILKGKFATPKCMTPDANDFVRKLLRKNAERRLGCKKGAIELKGHVFFKSTDWAQVKKRQCEPPYIPDVRSETDVSNFDTMFTSKSPRESNSVPSKSTSDLPPENLRFPEFDYVAEEFCEKVSDDTSCENGVHDVIASKSLSASSSRTSGVSSGSSASSSVSSPSSADSLHTHTDSSQDLARIANQLQKQLCNHGS